MISVNLHNPKTCAYCKDSHHLPLSEFDLVPWAMHITARLAEVEAELVSHRRLGPRLDLNEEESKIQAEGVEQMVKDLKKTL